MLPPGVRAITRVTRAAVREPCRSFGAACPGRLRSVPGSAEPDGLPGRRRAETPPSPRSAEPEKTDDNMPSRRYPHLTTFATACDRDHPGAHQSGAREAFAQSGFPPRQSTPKVLVHLAVPCGRAASGW